MRYPLFVVLVTFLCCSSPSDNRQKDDSTKDSTLLAKHRFDSLSQDETNDLVKSFKEEILDINSYYFSNVKSLSDLRKMVSHIHILNDSLKKLNNGEGILPYRLIGIHSLVYNEGTKRELLDSILENKLSKNDLKTVLPTLIIQDAISQNFIGFNRLDSIYLANFDQYSSDFYTNIKIYRSIIKDFDSLNSINLRQDSLLFYKGYLFDSKFNIVWNEHGGGYNKRIPFAYYDTLLANYPKSSLADNAELNKVIYYEGLSHEGGDYTSNLTFIDKYLDFLNRYPNSDSTRWVYYQIANLYSTAEISDKKERLPKLQKGLEYLNLVKNSFPDYRNKEVSNIEDLLRERLSSFGFKLRISSDTCCYHSNQPILIYYTLTNDTDSTKSTTLFEDFPNFDTKVYNLILKSEKSYNSKTQEIALKPSEYYTEVFDITKYRLWKI